MERNKSNDSLGCGSSQGSEITLNVQTTTGGNFSISVDSAHSVDQLKKIVSKKFKVSKDRICLLHRERQLREGSLEDNGLVEGSRVILLPSVETGLLTQRPENSVMQALESLNDSQVNDFLSGKSPLNLTMRLGDHMMLIQLQLSTLNPVGGAASSSAPGPSSSKPRPRPSPTSHRAPHKKGDKFLWKSSRQTDVQEARAGEEGAEDAGKAPPADKPQSPDTETDNPNDLKSFLRKQDIETLQNAFEIFKSLAEMREDIAKEEEDSPAGDVCDKYSCEQKPRGRAARAGEEETLDEQSPIKSLSNLVSSPLKSSPYPNIPSKHLPEHAEEKPLPKYVPLPSSLKNNLIESILGDADISQASGSAGELASPSPNITDPIAANLTSCLCSTLNPDYICSSNCLPASHPITKMDSHLPDMEFCDDQNHVIIDSPMDEYPMENLFNNAVDQGLFRNPPRDCDPADTFSNSSSDSKETRDKYVTKPGPSTSRSSYPETSESTKNKRLHYLLHKTSKNSNPIIQSKQKAFMQSLVNKHLKKTSQQATADASHDGAPPSSPGSSANKTHKDWEEDSVFRVPAVPAKPGSKPDSPTAGPSTVSDTKALIEASKNLTQTLKKLSKEVLTSKVDLANEESARSKIGQGAVIESMKHHGKGIYSGTFSGTLNPALQDSFGRPKRDISTIIHILNDLLCATPPQYRRGARITFEPTHTITPTSSPGSKVRSPEVRSVPPACGAEGGECSCSKCAPGSSAYSAPLAVTKCAYGECNGHYPPGGSGSSSSSSCLCGRTCSERLGCSCAHKQSQPHKPSRKPPPCHSADALALDNSKTKCKLDQLRLVMQQKKQRREARKMKAAPYASAGPGAKQPDAGEEIDTLA